MLADQLGTVDAGGTFATAIFDALEAAKDAAGEADSSDPTVANEKLADELAAAIYEFFITALVTTKVGATVETVTASTAITKETDGSGTGSGEGEGFGQGNGDRASEGGIS